MPRVCGIATAEVKGMPMVPRDRIQAVIGLGLFMDRYATRRGTYSGTNSAARQVTLIHAACIAAANNLVSKPYTFLETRRNLLIDGDINLLDLIGEQFSVGPVRMRGTEECLPCSIPSRMARKDDFVKYFAGRSGIRAEVLTTGFIQLRDELVLIRS